jgi:uncharacterized protein (DUF1778 family)
MPSKRRMPAASAVMPPKSKRLEARVTVAQKRLLQRAAELEGRSLTDFLVASAQEAAKRTIRDHEIMRLNGEDREIFISSLLNPPRPSAKLVESAGRYRRMMR